MTEARARTATIEDLPGMLDVIEAAFTTWPPVDTPVPPIDYLRWKLGPGGESAISDHIVVELAGRVVAVRLRWSAGVRIGGAHHRWEHSADMAVHPDFQGRGIARTLAELRDRGFEDTGNVGLSTTSNSAQIQHMDGAPRNNRPLTAWTHHRSPRAFIATHVRSGGARQLLTATTALMRRRRVRGIAETALRTGAIEELHRFDERTDALWAAAGASFEVATDRTAAYLNWRHRDPRGGSTFVPACQDRGRCLGYAVFKANGKVVNVLDLVVEPGRDAVGAALLSAGVEELGRRGHRAFACWLPAGHAYEAALAGAGFIATTTRHYQFANQLFDDGSAEEQQILRDSAARFHITMSDFDFF